MMGWGGVASQPFGLNFRNKHFQVAFIFALYLSLRFMPARALNLATQKQTLLQRSVLTSLKRTLLTKASFLLRRNSPPFGGLVFFASPKKGSKERRLRAQVWLRQTSLTAHGFSGAKRNWISCNLRLRRFEHASPYFPKNRAPFGCASRREASLPIRL